MSNEQADQAEETEKSTYFEKQERAIAFRNIKAKYKPILKTKTKNDLINLIVDLGIQITELKEQSKAQQGENDA